MCFPFTKIEGKPTDQSRRNSAADTVTGRADRKQGRVTDAEGERSVLARALRRPNLDILVALKDGDSYSAHSGCMPE